jgi:hypothetical protein
LRKSRLAIVHEIRIRPFLLRFVGWKCAQSDPDGVHPLPFSSREVPPPTLKELIYRSLEPKRFAKNCAANGVWESSIAPTGTARKCIQVEPRTRDGFSTRWLSVWLQLKGVTSPMPHFRICPSVARTSWRILCGSAQGTFRRRIRP